MLNIKMDKTVVECVSKRYIIKMSLSIKQSRNFKNTYKSFLQKIKFNLRRINDISLPTLIGGIY